MKNRSAKTYSCSSLLSVALMVFIIGVSFPVLAQEKTKAQPKRLTTHLPVPTSPVQYKVTVDYFNHLLDGKFVDKIRLTGIYTLDLKNKSRRWNEVYVSKSNEPDGRYPEGTKQLYIENFTYEPTEKILSPEFFTGFPFDAVQAKNLVWDMAGIEAFAWQHLDSLSLNKLYNAKNMNGQAALAGLGTFENRNIQLIWRGESTINGRPCHLIDYRAMDNPLNVSFPMGDKTFNMKGRSHYWGTIYESPRERSFEYAELLEDVVMEIKMSDQPVPTYTYTTRFMTVEKK